MDLHIVNETSRLKAVVLGTAQSNGPIPKIEDCYDPKSIESILAGTYPLEKDMANEMSRCYTVDNDFCALGLVRPRVFCRKPDMIDEESLEVRSECINRVQSGRL